MKTSKKILYIGNNLSIATNNITTISTLSDWLTKEGITVYKSSSKKNKIFRLLDMCFAVIRLRRSINYILIDTYSSSNFIYAYFTSQLARIFKIKYIPILHGGNLPKRLKNNAKLSNHIFANAYINVTPSNYLKSEFAKFGYVTKLIPNAIEFENYIFKERKVLSPKLLYVRAFAEIYNPLMAINVLAILKKKYSKATLCMIGPDKDGTLAKALQLAKQLNLEESIEFTGFMSKNDWHIKSTEYDIFINTANVDNTPVSIVEAMALGLPVVSTNAGGIPYLISNKKDGLLVEPNNSSQMAEKIISLLEGEYNNMAKAANIKAEQLSWKFVKFKWLKILK